MIRNIERATGQKIESARVPTIADLQARRLDLTRSALREAILAGELDRFRVVVEALTGEFDVMDVALAAVKLAHAAEGGDGDEEEDIPTPQREQQRSDPRRMRPPLSGGRMPGVARIFFNAGREAGIAPRDLVGAITNQAGLPGKDVRGIEIADRFSLVDVPDDAADHVIESLNGARIRGRKVQVRRDKREERRR